MLNMVMGSSFQELCGQSYVEVQVGAFVHSRSRIETQFAEFRWPHRDLCQVAPAFKKQSGGQLEHVE